MPLLTLLILLQISWIRDLDESLRLCIILSLVAGFASLMKFLFKILKH